MDDVYYKKYIKYKNKYIKLKGGSSNSCLDQLKIDIEQNKDKNIKLNFKKIDDINTVLIDLISKNEGLTKILPMTTIKQILTTYISDKKNEIDIIKEYNKILKYIKAYDYTNIENYIFLSRNNSILFFLKIINEYASIYDCYFLGDSTYKFKNMMEILRPDLTFESILFSGNMYHKKTNELKEKYVEELIENIDNYHKNNKSIVDKIFTNLSDNKKKKIAIFDFVDSGKSLATFVFFLKKLNKFYNIPSIDSVIKNRILFINFVKNEITTDKKFKDITKIIGLPNEYINYLLININIIGSIWEHIVNSDHDVSKICARCLPYYSPDLWKTTPDIYIDDTNNEPNYLGCNLNRFYLYIYLINQFNNINPDINKLQFKKTTMSQYYIYGDMFAFIPELRSNIDPTNKIKLLIDIEIKVPSSA